MNLDREIRRTRLLKWLVSPSGAFVSMVALLALLGLCGWGSLAAGRSIMAQVVPTRTLTPSPTCTAALGPAATPTAAPTSTRRAPEITPSFTLTSSPALPTATSPALPTATSAATPNAPPATVTPMPTLGVTPAAGDQLLWKVDASTLAYVPPAGGLDAFWIDAHLVTNEQFRSFVEAVGYRTGAETRGYGWAWNPVAFRRVWSMSWRTPRGAGSSLEGLDQHPVILIAWEEAAVYCQWVGKRLPTKAEWRLAATGTSGQTYPWGNQAPNSTLLNYCDVQCPWTETRDNDGYLYTSPVCAFTRGNSPYGLCDMAGNVWEWVDSWEEAGEKRTICGGSWAHPATDAAICVGQEPNVPLNVVGLRCALDADFEIAVQGNALVPAEGQ